MNDPTIAQRVLFSDLAERPLLATFDQPHASSDGGAILLKAADRPLGLLGALTATVPDARASARVPHGVGDLLAHRVFAIACGHPDGNDADRLADDPIHTLVLGRDPIDGGRLASPPTSARFEQTAAPRMLLAMSEALADTIIARHRRRRRRGVRLITIDLDVTEDQTHGAQQLTFFNAFTTSMSLNGSSTSQRATSRQDSSSCSVGKRDCGAGKSWRWSGGMLICTCGFRKF